MEERKAPIKVSVLCPGFVKTNIVNTERNRPLALRNEPATRSPQDQAFWDYMNARAEAGMPPLQVADQVFKAIREERFYIVTEPELIEAVRLRMDSLLRGDNPQPLTPPDSSLS